MRRPDWTLRVAVPADADAVSAALADAYPALMAPAYDPNVLSAILPAMVGANPALLASGTFYVAEAAKAGIVACGGWTWEEPGSGRRTDGVAHLRHFGTRTAWGGKGLGRAIFERCHSEALAAGAGTFNCYASLNAEPFYRALGFEVVHRLDIRMSNGMTCPTLVMTRGIAGAANRPST